MLLLVAMLAPAADAAPATARTKVTLKRLGPPAVAGSPIRLRVRAHVPRGRFITRYVVRFGSRVKPRHGLRRPRELRHTYTRAGRYRVTLTLIDNRRRRSVGRLWHTVRPAPATFLPAAPAPQPAPPTGVVTVPAGIPADCSVDVQAQLESFIAAQPDGSTIEFPAGGCYAQSDRIMVRDRSNLTIDANGSSFHSSAPNVGGRIAGNWLVVRGANVRLTDMRIVGSFHLSGARSQQRVNDATVGAVGNPFNMGVGIYGGSAIHVTDMTIEHVFGDGVTIAMAHYVDGLAADPRDLPRDVHIERVRVTKAARHCISPSQGDGIWLQDSNLTDCWYGGVDAELDSVNQTLKNLHILRNTFDGVLMFGVLVPVAGVGQNTENVEIRDNTFYGAPDNRCNTTIEVGSYPTNPHTIKNVVVAGNSLLGRSGLAVSFDHVEGGAITGNAAPGYREGGCTHPAPTPFARLTNSDAVTVADNSPLP